MQLHQHSQSFGAGSVIYHVPYGTTSKLVGFQSSIYISTDRRYSENLVSRLDFPKT